MSEEREIAQPLSLISTKSGRWPVMMALPHVTCALFGLIKIIILTQPNNFLSCKWGRAIMGLKDGAHRNLAKN
jgi:hypothetical protein